MRPPPRCCSAIAECLNIDSGYCRIVSGRCFKAVYLFEVCHNKKSSLFITFASRRKAVCSGIGDPVFVPAVDSGDGIHLPLMVVFCFRLCLLVHIVHRSGRTPLLPLYALLLFKEPSELTLRTLLAFDELGVSRCTPNVFQALVLSRFFHAVVMYFTSSASFDQYSQLLIEIKPISCESSMKNRSSLQ